MSVLSSALAPSFLRSCPVRTDIGGERYQRRSPLRTMVLREIRSLRSLAFAPRTPLGDIATVVDALSAWRKGDADVRIRIRIYVLQYMYMLAGAATKYFSSPP